MDVRVDNHHSVQADARAWSLHEPVATPDGTRGSTYVVPMPVDARAPKPVSALAHAGSTTPSSTSASPQPRATVRLSANGSAAAQLPSFELPDVSRWTKGATLVRLGAALATGATASALWPAVLTMTAGYGVSRWIGHLSTQPKDTTQKYVPLRDPTVGPLEGRRPLGPHPVLDAPPGYEDHPLPPETTRPGGRAQVDARWTAPLRGSERAPQLPALPTFTPPGVSSLDLHLSTLDPIDWPVILPSGVLIERPYTLDGVQYPLQGDQMDVYRDPEQPKTTYKYVRRYQGNAILSSAEQVRVARTLADVQNELGWVAHAASEHGRHIELEWADGPWVKQSFLKGMQRSNTQLSAEQVKWANQVSKEMLDSVLDYTKSEYPKGEQREGSYLFDYDETISAWVDHLEHNFILGQDNKTVYWFDNSAVMPQRFRRFFGF